MTVGQPRKGALLELAYWGNSGLACAGWPPAGQPAQCKLPGRVHT